MTFSSSTTNEANELPVHPTWFRIAHWINAFVVIVMMASGWRIYNASPIFDFQFPREITLGGWLGGALQWHFAGMWLLSINGLIYLLLNFFSGRLKDRFSPLRFCDVWFDLCDFLRGRLKHDDQRHYNSLQRAAYLFVLIDSIVLVISGLILWKPVQFPLLRELFGGYDLSRRIHFFSMLTLLVFTIGHLLMVVLVPRTLITMLRDH